MYRIALICLLLTSHSTAFAGKKNKIRSDATYVLENIQYVHDQRDLNDIKALLKRARILTQQSAYRNSYRPVSPEQHENPAIAANDACRTLVRKNYAPHYAKEQCEPIRTQAQLSCMQAVVNKYSPQYAKDVCKGLSPRQVNCVKNIMKNYAPHYAREQCI